MTDASVDRMNCRGNTLSFQRDTFITEWFVNDGRGLEQGWTISQRPAGASAVAGSTVGPDTGSSSGRASGPRARAAAASAAASHSPSLVMAMGTMS